MADKSPPVRQDSKKRLGTGDSGRRARFKERSHELEKGRSAPNLFGEKAPLPLTEEEAVTVGHGLGHEFQRKTFFQMTHCHHCTELLWGIKGQGLQCTGERLTHGRGETLAWSPASPSSFLLHAVQKQHSESLLAAKKSWRDARLEKLQLCKLCIYPNYSATCEYSVIVLL